MITTRYLHSSLAALLILCTAVLQLIAADKPEDFKHAKQAIQTQLRSKQPADRIQAFYKLKKFHDPDAARLVLQLGLKDAAPEVRVAAYETLRAYAGDADVCNLLFASLRKASKAKEPVGADVLLAVLLASDVEETSKDLTSFLDKQLVSSAGGAMLVALTADNLGLHGAEEDLPLLKKLTATRLFADNFAVRRAVVQAIMRIREPATIELLIALLGDLKGESRGDIVQYLAEITRQEYGEDAVAWKKWWDGAKATFEYPPLARGLAQVARDPGGNPTSYYGLPLFAQRLVFVFDTSGSMGGPRLAAAQRELIGAINSLPEETYFGVVVFNSRVAAWQKQLVAATRNNRDAAARFVSGLVAREQTATFDALSAAFNYDAEAVYLLTDGAPTTGRVTNSVDIVANITRANLARRMSIYTIGIGAGPEGGPFDAFLSELAMQNYGQYRRVDN